MANIVEQINDGLTTTLGTTLGSPYQELSHMINIEAENLKGNKQRYGVRPLGGSSAAGLTRNYTLDHEFEIIISDEYFPNPSNDQNQREAAFGLFNKMDSFLKEVFISKAGLPSIILNIDNISMDEPNYEIKNVVILRAQLNIKYRQPVNSL